VRRFGVGVFDQIVNAHPWPTAPLRANYLGAAAAGADSFWVGDHLNSLFPRSIATRQYVPGPEHSQLQLLSRITLARFRPDSE
jgi:hypothetical protein